MTGEGVALIITASGGFIMQLLTYFKVGKVHREMNGMKEEIVRAEKNISKTEGIAEGKQIEKDIQKNA